MKVLILAIGKRHEAVFKAAIGDYTKRLSRFATIGWQLLDPARGKQEAATTKRFETQALLGELQPDDVVILLDERGKQLRSRQLGEFLDQQKQQATKRLVFIIGGPYGVDELLRARATLVWSLSMLTFPHQLVRLILVEQLYRASTISGGLPYHHE